MIELKYLRKVEGGGYQIAVELGRFQLFDYLNRLRQKKGSNELKTKFGGFLCGVCEFSFLGMPKEVFDYPDMNYAIKRLSARLGSIFEAFRLMAEEAIKRRKDKNRGVEGGLPPEVIRELFLTLLPYYLGSRVGIDGDGLPLDELRFVLDEMIGKMPDKLDGNNQSSTGKNVITEEFRHLDSFSRLSGDTGFQAEESTKTDFHDFALIVTMPEYQVDQEGLEKREITNTIMDGGKRHEDALSIAFRLLLNKEEDVFNTLRVIGYKYLGEKVKEINQHYRKLLASRDIARLLPKNLDKLDELSQQSPKQYDVLKNKAQEYASKHGVKNVISYLPFHNEFGGPTPEKEKVIQRIFPNISIEKIHTWLSFGREQVLKL